MSVEPYYSDDAVTIYHGDCREILPHVEADVVVTDPPYGINLDTERTTRQTPRTANGTKRTGIAHRAVRGDDEPFDPSPVLALGLPTLLFGANHFARFLPDGRWHVWDKTGGGAAPTGLNNEFEIIWTSYPSGRGRVIRYEWAGVQRINKHPDSFLHPTQKPVGLLVDLIQAAPTGVTLDPYMGSGTTLRAAKDLGRRAIGIEVEERYCEIAANRCAQEVLDFG